MSYPCSNGGTCTDDGAYDKYTCTCPGEFAGQQCQGNFETIVCWFVFRLLMFSPDANIKVRLALDPRNSSLTIRAHVSDWLF